MGLKPANIKLIGKAPPISLLVCILKQPRSLQKLKIAPVVEVWYSKTVIKQLKMEGCDSITGQIAFV